MIHAHFPGNWLVYLHVPLQKGGYRWLTDNKTTVTQKFPLSASPKIFSVSTMIQNRNT